MKKSLKKWLALLSAAALLLSVLTATSIFTLAADDDVEYDVKKLATEYDSVSDASLFHLSDLPQYAGESAYRFSAGSSTTGWVVYDSGRESKSFQAVAVLGDSAETTKALLSFAVSNDKETWTDVSVSSVATDPEGDGWPVCVYAGASEEAFRYLKVNFNGSLYTYDPGLYNVAFSASSTTVYDVTKGPTEYSSVSDASLYKASDLPSVEGVTPYRFSTGVATDGWVVFDAGKDVNAFKANAVLGNTADSTIAMLTYEVSSDNSTWIPVTTTASASDPEGDGWPVCVYTGSTAENFRYLKVIFTGSAYNYDPGLANVYFGTAASSEEDTGVVSYAIKKMATEGVASSEDGSTLKTDIKPDQLEAEYAAFVKEDGTMGTGNIVFTSDKPITDFHVSAFEATVIAGLTPVVEISKDGSTWETAATERVEGAAHPNPNWGNAYYVDYNGTLAAADGYYHLRVTLPANPWALPAPSLAYVEYNMGEAPDVSEEESSAPESSEEESSAPESSEEESSAPESSEEESSEEESSTPVPEKPDNFNNKKFPPEMKLDASEEGGKLAPQTEDVANGYYSIVSADASKQINGSLIVESTSVITAYNFATLESDTWNGNWSFAASADGETWVELMPTIVKGQQASNPNWGPVYQRENYGTLDEAAGYKYLRATVTTGGFTVPFPALAYVEYATEGLADGVLEESENLPDLDLPSEPTYFAQGHSNGVFKLDNMVLGFNNQNIEMFGADNGLMAMSAMPSSVIMYTPNVRDFRFVVSVNGSWKDIVVKAYGRTEQYGEETEIKLIRTGDVRPAVENPSGMICPWYLYRVADRDNMAQDYEYIRVVITNSAWSQIHDFTYFYDGPAPGDVPDDEKAEPVDPDGTEREGVQTINGIKGNLGAIDSDNMGLTSNGNNSNYIGASSGIVIYPDDAKDAWAVFATEGINNFWVKFLIGNADVAANFKAKFYVAPAADADESEWTEISAHIEECTDKKQPTGWKALEYVMDEDQVIPVGSNVLKVFIPAAENNNIGTSCQIARVDYTYAIPEADPLPEKAEPDSANGEKALLEDLAGQHLTTEEGGLAEEEYGLEWMMQNLGGENGKDKVLYKIDYESYLIYKLDGAVTGIDIRGYRHEDCVDDLLVYVSKDGSEWIALEDFTRADSKLYGGPVNYAHIVSAEDIPAGMNYVKVELPELEVFTDITISDIQILYNKTLLDDATDNNNGTDNDTDDKNESNPDTGVVLPLAALLLAGMSGATLVVGRKRDDR